LMTENCMIEKRSTPGSKIPYAVCRWMNGHQQYSAISAVQNMLSVLNDAKNVSIKYLRIMQIQARVWGASMRDINVKLRSGLFVLALILILLPVAVAADSAEQKGLEIAKEFEKRNSGFLNYKVKMKMHLMSRSGKARTRQLHSKVLELDNDGDKTLVVFDTPRDVRGTAFLSFSHKKGDDEQWLYLPALKRIKRIASGNKSSPFMGSEFSYEDMSNQELQKYSYIWIRDETLNGIASFVLERYPLETNSGYIKQIVWIDKSEYRMLKVDFYDRKKAHIKTLNLSDYTEFKSRYWKPMTLVMENHKTGKSTTIEFSEYDFTVDIDEKDFTQNSLRRAR
jgi:outer membrane lipoprotein-sorting protein